MDYEVIDTITGDSFEPGDIVSVRGSLWEILGGYDDSEIDTCTYNATNLSANDGEEFVTVEYHTHYDLMGL